MKGEFEIFGWEIFGPGGDGLGLFFSAWVSGVAHDGEEAVGAKNRKAGVECFEGFFGLGDDCFVRAGEVAKVEHNGSYFCHVEMRNGGVGLVMKGEE